MTRITLFEERWYATRFVFGVGFGADEADALLDLGVTLIDANAPDCAIACRRQIRPACNSVQGSTASLASTALAALWNP